MTFILLVLFITFIVVPIFKIVAAVWRTQRAAKNYFRAAREQAEKAAEKQQEQAKKKKKINPSDGEFVNFEELPPDNENSSTETKTEIIVEQQVVDIEWEDIETNSQK